MNDQFEALPNDQEITVLIKAIEIKAITTGKRRPSSDCLRKEALSFFRERKLAADESRCEDSPGELQILLVCLDID